MTDFLATILVFLIITYIVGIFVATSVYRVRAGLGLRHGLRITGPGGVGVDWLTVTMGKSFAWPVVLGVWMSGGRPEPRIVFNDKAVARRRATQA